MSTETKTSSSFAAIEEIADAVLYEGYVLYPYRASAVKNRQRWNFGGLFPQAYSEANRGSDAWQMQTECLIECPVEAGGAGAEPSVDIKLRFLQVSIREVGRVEMGKDPASAANYEVLPSVVIDGQTVHTWQEAIERDVSLESLSLAEITERPVIRRFSFPADRNVEIHRTDSNAPGDCPHFAESSEQNGDCPPRAPQSAPGSVVVVRRHEQIEGTIEISAAQVADGLFRLRVVVQNDTSLDGAGMKTRDEAAMFAMASTHLILACRGAQFVSLTDPPVECQQFVAACKNVGCWPVLAGEEPRRDFLLASPIILYDYPQIAPESAGQLFDGTEIDEILTLRIMSLTDQEKQEMRSLDDHTRAILERTENMPPEQLAKLHGAIRGLRKLHPTEIVADKK